MSDTDTGGTNVFLVPAEPEHFERTVVSAVDLTAHEDRPAALASLESARLWGAGGGDRAEQMFERLEAGDLLLFHHDGRYVGVGRVGRTFVDEDGWASDTFWDGASMGNLFTVTDFAAVDVDSGPVNGLFDYGADYAPGGLMRVADDRVTNRLDAIALAVVRYDERAD